jgi:anaerobic ribonucleoside-triphosphate reductase activating protein
MKEIPQQEYSDHVLNIGSYDPYTEAHGPGKRFALWTQGCSLTCKNCCNKSFLNSKVNRLMRTRNIFALIKRQKESNFPIEGVTLMGGEPTNQAKEIALLISRIKTELGLPILTFSGYVYKYLQKSVNEDIHKILELSDVLIDGPYIEAQHNPDDIRGSKNQQIITLDMKNSQSLDYTRQKPEMTLDSMAGNTVISQSGFVL